MSFLLKEITLTTRKLAVITRNIHIPLLFYSDCNNNVPSNDKFHLVWSNVSVSIVNGEQRVQNTLNNSNTSLHNKTISDFISSSEQCTDFRNKQLHFRPQLESYLDYSWNNWHIEV